MSGSKDIDSLFRESKRKKFDCPLCEETGFYGDFKLMGHAKIAHRDSLGDLASPEDEDAKKSFIQAASEKLQNRVSGASNSGKLGAKRGLSDNKALVGSSRRLNAPGSMPDDTEQQAGNLGRQPPDQGKLTSSTYIVKAGPGPNDTANVAGGRKQVMQSSVDERLAKGSAGPVPHDEASEYRRENTNLNEVTSHAVAPEPKVMESAKFYSNKNFAFSNNETEAQTNPQIPSRNIKKRQVSSEDGARPNNIPNRKTILPKSRTADPSRSPPGYGPIPYSQDKEMTIDDAEGEPESDIRMLLQPETRPISHDQLVVEVKGIYAGLVIVEAKCIAVDEKQSNNSQQDPSGQGHLKHDQWQTLIALHKQLLHEHHDFFLASQHPSASPNLSKLAHKYSMPARMWRHGIHAFLEVLRHRLPESFEHMLAFIYIAYSMMALLYETVSAFEDTWIECLGDLGRYRMAIEDDEPKDRDVWSGVARYWYLKAADKNPTVGRLYHHLAILARPYTLEQLSFYTRSLTCVTPFESARGSIMTVFNPILNGRESGHHRASSMEHLVIKAHGLLFLSTEKTFNELDDVLRELKDPGKRLVEEFVEKNGIRFKRTGVFLAVSNFAALFEFGALTEKKSPRSRLRRAFDLVGDPGNRLASTEESTSVTTSFQNLKSQDPDLNPSPSLTDDEIKTSKTVLNYASKLTFSIFEIILSMSDQDANHLLPMVHVTLVFIYSISSIPDVMTRLEAAIPWAAICSYLGRLKLDESLMEMMWDENTFPSAAGTTGRPPPDDYIIRGQVYTRWFFPNSWFADAKVDEEERMLEQSSHDAYRRIRVFWLAARLCSCNRWIQFVNDTKSFTTTAEFAAENFKSPREAAKTSPKAEENDQKGEMNEVEEDQTDDAYAMSDVAIDDQTPFKEPHYQSNSTTRTNTASTGNTDLTVATTVRQDSFNIVRADDPEEPEDTPMRDISPGKDHRSAASTKPAENEKTPWPTGLPVSPDISSLRKESADVDDVRIFSEESLRENDP